MRKDRAVPQPFSGREERGQPSRSRETEWKGILFTLSKVSFLVVCVYVEVCARVYRCLGRTETSGTLNPELQVV